MLVHMLHNSDSSSRLKLQEFAGPAMVAFSLQLCRQGNKFCFGQTSWATYTEALLLLPFVDRPTY